MRALRFEKTGSLDELKLVEIAQPIPGAGELLVQVKAAAINPSDIKNVLGKMHETTVPRTPGRDFAGVVTQGPVELMGAPVFGTGGSLGFGRDGSHAEFIAVPAVATAALPKGVSFEIGATLGLPFVTAYSALVSAAGVRAGETVLITGTTGAVGRAAVSIAASLGASVIGTARSAAKIPPAGAMPVSQWVNLETEDMPAKVREATGGRGADVVFDLVGGAMFEKCLASLAHSGRQVAITSGPERRVGFDLIDFYHNESRLFGVDSLKLSFEETGVILRELTSGLNKGTYPIPTNEEPVKTFPLDQGVQVYRDIAEGRLKQKAVLMI
ncbi:MAG: zinc-binding alcohol dehydrogenase family protein [Chthoniobacteraceae bacterium]|jgi:NADPH:quinone reductase-like Zn-dependent oxidoreductase